jgi:hypothetical protein
MAAGWHQFADWQPPRYAQTMYRDERAIRNYALHLALMVRRRGSVLALYERYDQKRKIGEYHTWAAVERAIRRYGNDRLRDSPKRKKQKRR